jgi:hypothetical protein
MTRRPDHHKYDLGDSYLWQVTTISGCLDAAKMTVGPAPDLRTVTSMGVEISALASSKLAVFGRRSLTSARAGCMRLSLLNQVGVREKA